jgi:hypothetical protein
VIFYLPVVTHEHPPSSNIIIYVPCLTFKWGVCLDSWRTRSSWDRDHGINMCTCKICCLQFHGGRNGSRARAAADFLRKGVGSIIMYPAAVLGAFASLHNLLHYFFLSLYGSSQPNKLESPRWHPHESAIESSVGGVQNVHNRSWMIRLLKDYMNRWRNYHHSSFYHRLN